MEVTFSNPFYLWALLVVPVLIVLYFVSLKYSKALTVKFANFVALSRVAGTVGESSNFGVLFVRILALVFIILSISGMTFWYYGESANKDYVLVIDSSASMSLGENLMPNRLESVKIAASNFIDGLPISSKVGVISFSGTSFVEQPLTIEKNLAKEAIENIQINTVGGTDIENAIITGANILIPSKKAKVIIILTDGRSNIGVSEETAISYAIANHIIVHTIGVGSQSESEFGDLILGLDEESLKNIAELTLGNYYFVENDEDLKGVYRGLVENPALGNNPIDLAFYLLLAALILLLFDWMLGATIYRKIP